MDEEVSTPVAPAWIDMVYGLTDGKQARVKLVYLKSWIVGLSLMYFFMFCVLPPCRLSGN